MFQKFLIWEGWVNLFDKLSVYTENIAWVLYNHLGAAEFKMLAPFYFGEAYKKGGV
jgi:hypothetical protein